ncbi:MAG: class I SAM-dependent methyltransferase [Deltaproteobacteria bacterium]|nr:class I SAM-dependent methyltransferase [Deltaproteobacteria bacterium]
MATSVHADLIRKKPFLKELYVHYYDEFLHAHESAPPGLRLEIGSGAGFLEEIVPDVVSFDIRPGADVAAVASALELPLRAGTVGAIFMLNVLHHLPDIRRFFIEVGRVLRPGGRAVFIEPYVSPFSRLVYKNFHHEPFNPESPDWTLEASGPMSSANGALPWIVFVRDRTRFESEFPDLEIRRIEPHTAFLYLLSGGVSMRSLVPGFAFGTCRAAEGFMGPAIRHAATMMTVEVVCAR